MRMLNCPCRRPFSASKRFAAKRAQIAQRPGGIQHAEFLKRLSVTLLKSPAAPGGVQPLRLAIPKRPDHSNQYNAKRYTRGEVAPAVFAAGGVSETEPTGGKTVGATLYNGLSCLNSTWWAWALTPPIRF